MSSTSLAAVIQTTKTKREELVGWHLLNSPLFDENGEMALIIMLPQQVRTLEQVRHDLLVWLGDRFERKEAQS